MQKTVSGLLLTAQYDGCQLKHRSTLNSAPSESTTAQATVNVINTTTASATKPWFPDRKDITCKNLLFYVLTTPLHISNLIINSGAKTLINTCCLTGAYFLLQTA
jgi:hypothetical protein